MTDAPLTMNEDQLKVTRSDEITPETGQTFHARRYSGVSKENTAATKIWFGKVFTGPSESSGAHHHGEAQTGGYLFRGRGYIRYGHRYEKVIYMDEGDFVFVPPYMPHIEGNCSRTEELIWMTTRTPDNIVVNLENEDIADIEIEYTD